MVILFKDNNILPLKDIGQIEINGPVMEKQDMVAFFVKIDEAYGKFALYENGKWRVSGFGSGYSGKIESFIIGLITMAFQL